jgi:predicted TIM-barrel fold metal-dependent hydrolase
MVPLWDPIAAAREVRHNAARGVRAVTFPELPSDLGLPSIHDSAGHWLPFLEACEETGTVLCMHIGSASTVAMTSEDAPHAVVLTLTPFNSQKSLADWLFSGHLARFPHLKLALSESQIGWMPYVMERVDRIWRIHNAKAQIPDALTEPPTSYMADRVFGCFFEDDFGLACRDTIGINQITFETDYPHQDSTWPTSCQYLEEVMKDLSSAEINTIVRENPIKMLDLPGTI